MKPHLITATACILAHFTTIASAGQIHVFTSDAAGFNTHSAWYDDGREVTVIDTQFTPRLAEQLVADIHRQTRSPITRVIVTHPNPDKFNALSVFHREGAQSIASTRTAAAIPGVDAYKRYYWIKIAQAFTEDTYPKIEPVKTTFTGQMKIQLKSGETLTLVELEHPGVSSNQTVVRIDRTGDLIVGDLVHTHTHAWLEGGIVEGRPQYNLAGWKSDLQQLLTLGKVGGKVYGGRGDFVPLAEAVSTQSTYLDAVDALVTDYIQQLGAKVEELQDPGKQAAHYQALQDKIARRFPDYAMPELIGYSIYGLVQAKLAALSHQAVQP